MNIELNAEFFPKYESFLPYYEKIAAYTFSLLHVPSSYEIDVSFVDEDTIQQLNRDYRNKDSVTDVISFAYNDGENPVSFSYQEDALQILGEIYICIPRAIKQAEEIGNSLGRELCFLFAHGLLHLLGYDHMNDEEAKEMFSLQNQILEILGGDYGNETIN